MARTVAEIIKQLQETYKPEEYIAVPFIWDKGEAEDWAETPLTEDQWKEVIDSYEGDEHFCDWSAEHMAEMLAPFTPEEN